MQPPLLPPPPLEPMPLGSRHYLVALQSHQGERNALRNVSELTAERMTPLIEFVGPKDQARSLAGETIARWAKEIADVWASRPCFVDIKRLKPGRKVAIGKTTGPVLKAIHDACRKRGLLFVPVLPLDAADAYLQVVRDSVMQDRRGVCLRYRYMEMVLPTGTDIVNWLRGILGQVGVSVENADLLIDLGYLGPDDSLTAQTIARLVDRVIGVGGWRSLALLGTSIPSTMSSIREGTLGSLERKEWCLWKELQAKPLVRFPAFGDYGIQHPNPPQEGGGPGMRANIRYTLSDRTLVARGRGSVTEEGNKQYRELCEHLVMHPAFSGTSYSWGDDVVLDCAEGRVPPGAQNLWRGAGTSHHLRYVTDQIAAMP